MNDDSNKTSASPRSKFKFGLRQLFYATALIASGLALSPSTIGLSLFVLIVWGIVFFSSRPWIMLGLLLLGVIVVSALWPTIQVLREPPYYASCRNNLKQIMLAIMTYESVNGRFPKDRIVVLDDGTELRHSWRIEILPMLEQGALFNSYDFKEPWDGPNNAKLESSMPAIFHCPSRKFDMKTSYRLVNGPGTAFEFGTTTGLTDLHDGASSTIGLIEDSSNPTHWMEPGEFTAEEAAQAINSMTGAELVHQDESFFYSTAFGSGFATLDGETHWWPPKSDKPMKAGAFLIDDGYLFDPDVYGQPVVKIKYGVWSALAIYLVLILLPALFLRGAKKVRRKKTF